MEAVVTNCMLVKHWTGIHDVPKNVLDFKNLFSEASFWKYCWIRIKIQNSLDNDEGYEVMWMWIKKTWKTRKKESGLLMGWSGARRTCCWQRGLNRAALHVMLGQGDYSQFQEANPLPLVPLLLGHWHVGPGPHASDRAQWQRSPVKISAMAFETTSLEKRDKQS